MLRSLHRTILLVSLAGCSSEHSAELVFAPPGEPLPGLSEAELGRFLFGKAVFDRLTTPEEGLGPLFNEPRCFSCHDRPSSGGSGGALVLKATRFVDGSCDLLVAEGGDNIQRQATPLLVAHGIHGETVPASATDTVRVTAPSLYGLGLVAAIPSQSILRHADPEDVDGDGISGRAGRTSDGRLGRFGRKSEIATLLEFVDTALRFELGLTTTMNPIEETLNGKPLPAGVDPMAEPEIDERGMRVLTDYINFLAAPPRERPALQSSRDSIAEGQTIFESVGCTSCHTPQMTTGESDVPALSRKVVPLYSDLLLHDMGPGLADVCGENATPSEYRTARLWGLRDRSTFLHDGRASSPTEAILQHDGEAAGARTRFQALPARDLALLARFLSSL